MYSLLKATFLHQPEHWLIQVPTAEHFFFSYAQDVCSMGQGCSIFWLKVMSAFWAHRFFSIGRPIHVATIWSCWTFVIFGVCSWFLCLNYSKLLFVLLKMAELGSRPAAQYLEVSVLCEFQYCWGCCIPDRPDGVRCDPYCGHCCYVHCSESWYWVWNCIPDCGHSHHSWYICR